MGQLRAAKARAIARKAFANSRGFEFVADGFIAEAGAGRRLFLYDYFQERAWHTRTDVARIVGLCATGKCLCGSFD